MFFRRKVAKLLRKVVGQVFNPAKASRSKKPALVLMPRRALCLTFCIDLGVAAWKCRVRMQPPYVTSNVAAPGSGKE
jgi:hypothetical protein